MMNNLSTELQIASAIDSIKNMLLAKNAKYGNSALDPCRVFSKASTIEQLLVRIDDKLSRVKRGAGLVANDEDVINDLIGYLILLKIALQSDASDSVYEEIKDYYSNWEGEDVEPVYRKPSAQKGNMTLDEWHQAQLMGHRATD